MEQPRCQHPLHRHTLETVGNYDPRGIWSDGTTMWVADENDGKIYAYYMPSGS